VGLEAGFKRGGALDVARVVEVVDRQETLDFGIPASS